MTSLTEETARELIDAMRELAFIVKGLTGVLIDDRTDDEPAQPEPEPTRTYMDGSEVGS